LLAKQSQKGKKSLLRLNAQKERQLKTTPPAVSQHNEYGGHQQQPDDNSKCDSLRYSATSSLAGMSAAGESTDSSFADIIKVLDESSELALLVLKAGNEETRRLFK